jgi:flagellar hook assembly protein FlgD
MPTAGDVSVRVYDIKGRLVQTLVNTSKPAGEYNVTWNGFNNKGEAVASGVYFLRLEAPGVSITRKAVMLK